MAKKKILSKKKWNFVPRQKEWLLKLSKQMKLEFCLRNRKHVPCFYRVIKTRVEVWENEKMLWEHQPQANVPTAFSSSAKLSRVFVSIETLYMFSVSFRKHPRDFVSGNIEILGKQNSLFPSGPVIKCLILLNVQQVEETESYMN